MIENREPSIQLSTCVWYCDVLCTLEHATCFALRYFFGLALQVPSCIAAALAGALFHPQTHPPNEDGFAAAVYV